jgi:hypothetical protein
VATQHRDNDPFIVDEHILSNICWAEFDELNRDYDYDNLLRVIRFIKTGGARHIGRDYSEAVTHTLKQLRVPENQWTVIRAKASAYFKAAKHPSVLDDVYWEITVAEMTQEIFLYHRSSMTRSESLFGKRGFELGSVVVEGRPCRQKQVIDLHRRKCFEVTYRILSGKSCGHW